MTDTKELIDAAAWSVWHDESGKYVDVVDASWAFKQLERLTQALAEAERSLLGYGALYERINAAEARALAAEAENKRLKEQTGHWKPGTVFG
jgi:hypothetical protein